MTRIGEQWYRFRLFAARNAIPLVWLWAGTMLCGLGTVYYRLKKGEKVTSELALALAGCWHHVTVTPQYLFSPSLYT